MAERSGGDLGAVEEGGNGPTARSEISVELEAMIKEADAAMGKSVDHRRSVAGMGVATFCKEPFKPLPDEVGKVSGYWVLFLVCGHALSASGLLVVNKWALQAFPFVWVLTTLQFLPAAFVVALVGMLGLAQVDRVSFRKLWAFFPAAGMFFVTMTAGNAVVKRSNVETFIVMRSLVPIPCAFLEAVVLGEPCPRPLSWIGLGVIVLGALGYASMNRGLAARSLAWVVLYEVMMPVDAVLIKQLINTTGLSQWGLVLYQNLLAGLLGVGCTLVLEVGNGEPFGALPSLEGEMVASAAVPVVLSILCGISLSFFQMNVRKAVSSTAFMVLGVANKLLALLMNQLFLASTSNWLSIAAVATSIFGAVLFQQTVKGKGIAQAPAKKGKEQAEANPKALIAMLAGLLWAVVLFEFD